jgi:hypothetical protein
MSPIPAALRVASPAVRFPSRLVERWASFFDLVGWPWIADPCEVAGRVPDLLVEGAASFFVSVAPSLTRRQLDERAEAWRDVAADHPVLLVGVTPVLDIDPFEAGPGVGLFLGPQAWGQPDALGRLALCDARDAAASDVPCGELGVHHPRGSFRLHPCGDHDGDHHLRGPQVSAQAVRGLWRQAGERVRWPF